MHCYMLQKADEVQEELFIHILLRFQNDAQYSEQVEENIIVLHKLLEASKDGSCCTCLQVEHLTNQSLEREERR